MSIFQTFAQNVTSLNNKLGQLVSWFTLLMAIVTLLIVILRYGFGLGWIAMQEATQYLHASIFMLGAAFALNADEHVRVDIFYRNMSKKGQAKVNLLGSLLLLLPVMIFIWFMSWEYVLKSWQLQESSQAAGGLPLVYLLKSLILAFATLLSLQAVSIVITNVGIIRTEPTEGGDN